MVKMKKSICEAIMCPFVTDVGDRTSPGKSCFWNCSEFLTKNTCCYLCNKLTRDNSTCAINDEEPSELAWFMKRVKLKNLLKENSKHKCHTSNSKSI